MYNSSFVSNYFQTFVDSNPILSEFKAEILKFEALLEEVDAIPESIRVGAIVLMTGKLPQHCVCMLTLYSCAQHSKH